MSHSVSTNRRVPRDLNFTIEFPYNYRVIPRTKRHCRACTHCLINATPRLLSDRDVIIHKRHYPNLIVIGR